MQDNLQTFLLIALVVGVLQIIQGLRVGKRPGGLIIGKALQGGGVGWLASALIGYTNFGNQPFYLTVLVSVLTGTLLGWANGIKVRDRLKGASR